MCPDQSIPPSAAGRVLSQEELSALFDQACGLSALSTRNGPLPAVLDTDFIRTGLHDQLKQGRLPMSVWSSQEGSLRLFMEYDTLIETGEKLPKFAGRTHIHQDDRGRSRSGQGHDQTPAVRASGRAQR